MEEIYCLKCKKRTKTNNIQTVKSKNNRLMLRGTCSICGTTKNKFISNKEGKGVADTIIDKMPEMHMPGYNFLGPGTKLNKRLDKNNKPLAHSEPINELDAIALNHDVCYSKNKSFKNKNRICDKQMLHDLKELKPKSVKEWIDKKFTQGVIGSKYYSGLGN